jgi:hypothetical protein
MRDPQALLGGKTAQTPGAPAQIEGFVRGFFADRLFRKQGCDLPLLLSSTEHETHVLSRTLPVFQCSGLHCDPVRGGWTQRLSFGVNTACVPVFTFMCLDSQVDFA